MGDIIVGLDIKDVLFVVEKRGKAYQAMLLQDVEKILGKDSEIFKKVRKLVLDNYNGYTRSVLRAIFGNDFEELRK